MSNVIGIIAGVVVTILGILLLICWWPMFIKGLMATLPILLVLIGAGVLIYYISEIKSKSVMEKDEASPPEGNKKE